MDGEHSIAIWSGIAAFFGSLLAIGVIDFLTPDELYHLLGAFIVAFITSASVYSKQRLDDAKEEKESKK